ncbi:hypothetical protein A0H81_04643 [Grifola frondosa]|uniref:Uncharacterized protein n=1 Tax=Grifola frondosa TaxID=5627 RepID=A0A1C7MEB5_GRIFR|nr:hypothetical protein A0H81_04643 [Grifola frondosa]
MCVVVDEGRLYPARRRLPVIDDLPPEIKRALGCSLVNTHQKLSEREFYRIMPLGRERRDGRKFVSVPQYSVNWILWVTNMLSPSMHK